MLGPESRTFYVSGEAVYLWVSDAWSHDSRMRGAEAYIFRLPLDGSRPSAVGARGAPVDQFSFREDIADGLLNVLVRTDGGGDAMFRPEASEGEIALLRVPFGAFGDGSRRLTEPLPQLRRPAVTAGGPNRFVGDYVLYGAGKYHGGAGRRPGWSRLPSVRPRVELALPCGRRIEVLGRDAMVVGGGRQAWASPRASLAGWPRSATHGIPIRGRRKPQPRLLLQAGCGQHGGVRDRRASVARPARRPMRAFRSSAAMISFAGSTAPLARGELAASRKASPTIGAKRPASIVRQCRTIFLGRRTFACWLELSKAISPERRCANWAGQTAARRRGGR